MPGKRGRKPFSVKTESTRVYAESAKVLHEIAHLERLSLAHVVERYLNKSAMERDLANAKKKELERLTAAVGR